MTNDYKGYLSGLSRKQLTIEESNLRALIKLPLNWDAKELARIKLRTLNQLITKQ